MILNHKDAIEFIVQNTEDIGFNRYTILNLHSLLSNNLLANPVASGRLRSFGVGVTKSVYTPLGMPELIYELNRVELLSDAFMWAYHDRSAKQYAAQRQSPGDPDPFRLKYREAMRLLITEIVTGALLKNIAIGMIKVKAHELPKEDHSKFVEVVETELLNLHEGNFARYQIRPSEFKKSQVAWKEKNSVSPKLPFVSYFC